MDHELQLISDGDGLAVLGAPADIDLFLNSHGLADSSTEMGLNRLGTTMGRAAGLVQTGAEAAANSGRWVMLTKEVAQAAKVTGLMKSAKSGLSMGVIKGESGKIKGIVEFARGPGSSLANPALLTGVAGIMAQLAMQQTMDEILDYLARIDAKVDDVLRAQKDAALADMIGVGLVLDEAMAVRESVGRVSEVTWSKVQGSAATIARSQAYALRQLDALAEKLERKGQISDLAKNAKDAETKTREWLAVLSRCFQLQDALAILELDRVLDSSPEDLDQHRLGLRTARQSRRDLITGTTTQLLTRIATAVDTANAKVLLHPLASRSVVDSSNQLTADVEDFHQLLGLDRTADALDARRWSDAFAETRESALQVGLEGVSAVGRLGSTTTAAFRAVDLDGDGIPDKPRALSAAEGAGSAVKGAVGRVFRRRDAAKLPVAVEDLSEPGVDLPVVEPASYQPQPPRTSSTPSTPTDREESR